MLWSIVHCYMIIDTSLIVDYTISVLNKIIMLLSLTIWAWLWLDHTQSISVVVPKALLVEIFRNHHWSNAVVTWLTKTCCFLILWEIKWIEKLRHLTFCFVRTTPHHLVETNGDNCTNIWLDRKHLGIYNCPLRWCIQSYIEYDFSQWKVVY